MRAQNKKTRDYQGGCKKSRSLTRCFFKRAMDIQTGTLFTQNKLMILHLRPLEETAKMEKDNHMDQEPMTWTPR